MVRRTVILFTVVLATVGAPAGGALAQSAGDDQYSDPFGDTPAKTTNDSKKPQKVAAPKAAPETQPAAKSAPAAAGNTAPATATTSRAAPAATLARTGVDVRLVLAAGLLLTGAGIAILVRSRSARR